MYTDTVIRVIRKVTFPILEALADTDERLEALELLTETGHNVALTGEVLSGMFNEKETIYELDNVVEKIEKTFSVHMTDCHIRACLADCKDDNSSKAISVIVPMTFNDIRCGLNQLPDKTAFENVRLVRKHTTKERLMKLITDRIEPDRIPTMETIANIINSITDKYLDANSIWS